MQQAANTTNEMIKSGEVLFFVKFSSLWICMTFIFFNGCSKTRGVIKCPVFSLGAQRYVETFVLPK